MYVHDLMRSPAREAHLQELGKIDNFILIACLRLPRGHKDIDITIASI